MKNYKDIKKDLIDRDGAKCSICGKHLDINTVFVDHIFPVRLGGNDEIENFRILCNKCNAKVGPSSFNAYEFQRYIFSLVSLSSNYKNVRLEEPIGSEKDYVIDLMMDRKSINGWEEIVAEIKYSPSFTLDRINKVIHQFEIYKSIRQNAKFVFIFPGKLTDKSTSLFKKNNIEVWDLDYLQKEFKKEIAKTKHPVFKSLLMAGIKSAEKNEKYLINKLKECIPGKDEWSKYQKLIGEVLEVLFCPPLLLPLLENSDSSKVNRRDFIMPNYSETGFWAFMRSRYSADYIVVDAKNYRKKITKKEVLQIANYLKLHGTGLFSLIISRNGCGDSALHTLREIWAIDKKLIIVLDDNDVEQMLMEKVSNRNPDSIIRQKIEDFRLSL